MQRYYIEVAQGAIFMEQNMRFGLILGWLAVPKKSMLPWRVFFYVFMGKREIENF